MKTYKVVYEELYEVEVEVDAKDKEDAEDKVREYIWIPKTERETGSRIVSARVIGEVND